MAQGGDRTGPIFYYTWLEQFEQLPEEMRWPLIRAIIVYDRDGEKEDFDNAILKVLAEQYYIQIDNQQAKWADKAKRPARYDMDKFIPLFVEGWDNKDIAARIGCSDRTVQRRRKEWEQMTAQDDEE